MAILKCKLLVYQRLAMLLFQKVETKIILHLSSRSSRPTVTPPQGPCGVASHIDSCRVSHLHYRESHVEYVVIYW